MNNSVDIVHAFWEEVWNAHDPGAVDRFVVDDFVIGTGGEIVTGRENFKKWIEGFLAKINDLHLDVLESFQNADGSRVASPLAVDREEQRLRRHGAGSTGHRDD